MALSLYSKTTRLGTLTYKELDWPRFYYAFEPTQEYDAFRGLLDLEGKRLASPEYIDAAEKLDLNVVGDDGGCLRLSCIFLDGKRAVIRAGFIRDMQLEATSGYLRILLSK